VRAVVNNFYTLWALATQWSDILAGSTIADAWSQHRGELIIAVVGHGQLHFRLQAPVQCAFRAPRMARARRNTVSFFDHIHGCRINSVHVVPGDRILTLALEGGYALQAHLFGPRANLYLVDREGLIQVAFRRNSHWAGQLVPAPQPAGLPASFEDFQSRWDPVNCSAVRALSRALRIYDRTLVLEAMCRAGIAATQATACGVGELKALFASSHAVREALEEPQPRIYTGSNAFSLIPLVIYASAEEETYSAVGDAVRVWAGRALARTALASLREPLQTTLNQSATQARRVATRLRQQLKTPSRADTYERYGHLLMATPPHPPGASDIVLPDLLTNQDLVKIPLVASLNTIENAQRYYAKARKTRAARRMLLQRAEAAESRAAHLTALLEKVQKADSVAVVKKYQQMARTLLGVARQQDVERLPYRRYMLDSGYEAWVGKNARDSDQLTLRHARPFDLWMHARGTTGAHVVLRLPHRGSRPNPEIVRVAAALAAYHSKARGSALVPVIVTPRKYVRKRKGAPPGTVTVDREEVVMVEPAQAEV